MRQMSNLKSTDPKIANLIAGEKKRQRDVLQMIPSENYVSKAVLEALGSIFVNKYSEGYPQKRYYQGNDFVDPLESLCIERAKKLFRVAHVNVQPYSGSPGNLEVLAAVCQLGDPILSQHLSMGGHLSMGQQASWTSKYYQPYYYGLTKDGDVNWQELEEKAKKHRPKIIFSGGTGFTRIFDFGRYGQIADLVGAYFVADIAHIAGLVVGRCHPSPAKHAHIIMTTTHKTLRGPRGAMIMVTKKGLVKDGELPAKIDRSVFPGHQGGPHNHTIAALAVALKEAAESKFRKYAKQIVKNSKALARELQKYDFNLIGGGSENHMIWIDLRNKKIDGWTAAWALEAAGIVANRQTIPFDPRSAYYPSGLRLGTPAITSRGMREKEMKIIAGILNETIEYVANMDLRSIGSPIKEKDQASRRFFKKQIFKENQLVKIKEKVRKLCSKFPASGIDF